VRKGKILRMKPCCYKKMEYKKIRQTEVGRLAGGVEPLGTAALLAPAIEEGA
jgi:hypothetical protein